MSKREHKLGHAAHVKRHTVGTSNEISFSVLEAAKNKQTSDSAEGDKPHPFRFGHISLFSLPLRRKKTVATPTKEKGLPLSTGEFASADEPPPTASISTVDVGSPQADGLASSTTSAKLLSASRLAGVSAPGNWAASASSALSKAAAHSAEEEIARRKTRRKLRRVIAAACVVAIGLGMAGAGGWYLYQNYQAHLGQIETLNGALDSLRNANQAILDLDALVENPLDPDSLAKAPALLNQLPETRKKLKDADQVARNLSPELSEATDKEAASQTVTAVAGRNAMLDSGEQIMVLAQQYSDAASRLQAAWKQVLEADSLAREAATLITNTTNDTVTASMGKTAAATASFSAAQATLDDLARELPSVQLASLKDYVAKRLEAMTFAQASDQAFLARNKEETQAQNEAYNAADAAAATLATSLPQDVTQSVFEAFKWETGKLFETYSTARTQAGSADAFLRDYLGTNSK